MEQHIGTDDMGKIIIRLRRVEGQVRGLQRMLAEGRLGEEVFTQLSATKAALDRACTLLVALKMRERLAARFDNGMSQGAAAKAQPVEKAQASEHAKAIEEAMETFVKHSQWLDVVINDAGDDELL